MVNFVKSVFELIFGYNKNFSVKMPAIDYADNFVIKYPFKKNIGKNICYTCYYCCFLLSGLLVEHEMRFLYDV